MGSKAAVLRSLASYFFEKPAPLQAGIDEKNGGAGDMLSPAPSAFQRSDGANPLGTAFFICPKCFWIMPV